MRFAKIKIIIIIIHIKLICMQAVAQNTGAKMYLWLGKRISIGAWVYNAFRSSTVSINLEG